VLFQQIGNACERIKMHTVSPFPSDGPTRPLGVYFGSCADVAPVRIVPGVDWVFVTPEPSHPVAVEHWPSGCCGHALGLLNPTSFYQMFVDRLGPDWATDTTVDAPSWLWTSSAGQTLRVWPNCTVESMPAPAASLLEQCTVAFVHGYLPDKACFRRRCPKVRTAYVTGVGSEYTSDLFSAAHWINEGTWMPHDGDLMCDFGANPRTWYYKEDDYHEEESDDDYYEEESDDSS